MPEPENGSIGATDWSIFDLPAAHVFKIRNGRIYEIEAVGCIADSEITNGRDQVYR